MLRLWFHLVQWLPRNDGAKIGSWHAWCMQISVLSKLDRKASIHSSLYSLNRIRKTKGKISLDFHSNLQEINIQIFEIEFVMSGTLHSGECFAPIRGQMN